MVQSGRSSALDGRRGSQQRRPPFDADLLHVTVPSRRRTRFPAGVRVHRVALASDAVAELSGLPITTLPRTVIDCVRIGTPSAARTLLDRALQQQWLTLADIDADLRAGPNRWGNRAIRALRCECKAGDAVSERILHRLLRDAGITGWKPTAQVDVGFAMLRFDVVFTALRLIIEVDGWAVHSDVDRFRTDRTRQNAVMARGWTVLRFTWHDLVDRPTYVVATIRQMIARLRPSRAAS